jgi:hypothetical protein
MRKSDVILNYSRTRKWLMSLRSSVFLLAVVPAVTLGWFAVTGLITHYFGLACGWNDPLLSATRVCRVLDTAPQAILMTVTSVGGTLASFNWREGFAARALLFAHEAVFGVSSYLLFATSSTVIYANSETQRSFSLP